MLALAEPQERAIRHRAGPLLLIGEAGTGKTEVLARRFERLVADGTQPERVLALASTRATAQRLRERVEVLLDSPLEELWIGTWEQLCERLLRAHSTAAGLDPFFGVLGPAERLALLLDRLEELPLRRHEIRGNPAGLLARLLQQIDEVKAGSDPPDPELAELIAAHDRILADTCSLDRGDVYFTLSKLLDEQPDIRAAIAHRFVYVMVDELEDTTPAQRAILAALSEENPNQLYAVDGGGEGAGVSDWALGFSPDADATLVEPPGRKTGRRAQSDTPAPSPVPTVALTHQFRDPGRRSRSGWAGRGGNGRAQRPLPSRRPSRSLPAPRGPGCNRLVEGAGRPGRLGGGGAGIDPTTGRAARG